MQIASQSERWHKPNKLNIHDRSKQNPISKSNIHCYWSGGYVYFKTVVLDNWTIGYWKCQICIAPATPGMALISTNHAQRTCEYVNIVVRIHTNSIHTVSCVLDVRSTRFASHTMPGHYRIIKWTLWIECDLFVYTVRVYWVWALSIYIYKQTKCAIFVYETSLCMVHVCILYIYGHSVYSIMPTPQYTQIQMPQSYFFSLMLLLLVMCDRTTTISVQHFSLFICLFISVGHIGSHGTIMKWIANIPFFLSIVAELFGFVFLWCVCVCVGNWQNTAGLFWPLHSLSRSHIYTISVSTKKHTCGLKFETLAMYKYNVR